MTAESSPDLKGLTEQIDFKDSVNLHFNANEIKLCDYLAGSDPVRQVIIMEDVFEGLSRSDQTKAFKMLLQTYRRKIFQIERNVINLGPHGNARLFECRFDEEEEIRKKFKKPESKFKQPIEPRGEYSLAAVGQYQTIPDPPNSPYKGHTNRKTEAVEDIGLQNAVRSLLQQNREIDQ